MRLRPTPLISIGIPFYNDAEVLPRAIRSVFAQTFQDWELILVDDGSRDDSLRIVQNIRDPRVRVMSDGRHLTLAPRLNQISREARGKYLARMDADDLMHPERLEMQVHYMEAHHDVDLIGAAAYILDHQLNVIGKRGAGILSVTAADVLVNRGLFVHPTVFGQTKWFCENLYQEAEWCYRCEDYEMWIRTSLEGNSQLGCLSEPLLYYMEVGKFSFAKYRKTMQSARVIVNKYGKKVIGSLAARRLAGRFLMQECIYFLASRVGLENKLLLRRSYPLAPEERKRAMEGLRTISTCKVPGFDEVNAEVPNLKSV